METPVLPIKGVSKAKRIGWSTPHNQISLPYLKMLREHNKSRKLYGENPYVEVYQFDANLYGLLNPNCDGGTDVWTWLILGPEKAMLVGTAFGLGEIQVLVKRIGGDRPVLVVNSHSDRDQVLGNCRFDKVHCHENDEERVKRTCKPGAWDSMFDSRGRNRWMEFDRKDLPSYKAYELISVKDGHVFDLGGNYLVELIWTGGHTPGHSMFLDKQNRRLFPGDDVSSDTIRCGIALKDGGVDAEYVSLTAYRDRLARLVARSDEFDYLFPAHGFANLENNVLAACLDTLDQIIASPEVYDYETDPVLTTGGTNQKVVEKYVRGFTTIAYTEGGLSAGK